MSRTRRVVRTCRLWLELLEARDQPSNGLGAPLIDPSWLELHLSLWGRPRDLEASTPQRTLLEQGRAMASEAVGRAEVRTGEHAMPNSQVHVNRAVPTSPPAPDLALLAAAATTAQPRLQSVTIDTSEDGLANPHPGYRMLRVAGGAPSEVAGENLRYGSYLGYGGWDEARAVATDGRGYLYLTGTLDTLDPAYDQEAFVAKVHQSSGQLVWLNIFGGLGRDEGNGIDLDPQGFIYVSGAFTNEFGVLNGYVAKLNPAGDRFLWRRNVPVQPTPDTREAVLGSLRYHVPSDKVYYTGYLTVLSQWGSVKAGGMGRLEARDGALAPIAFVGWYFLPPNTGDLVGTGIDMDGQGNAYVALQFRSFQTGHTYGVLFRIQVAGPLPDLAWSRTYPATGLNGPRALAADGVGNTYTVGFATATGGAVVLEEMKHSPTGQLIYRYQGPILEGGLYAAGQAVAVDYLGRSYVAGSFLNEQENEDVFLSRITPRQVGKAYEFDLETLTFGGSGDDRALGLTGQFNPGAPRYAALVGATGSAGDFPITPDAFQPTYGGGDVDGFVARTRLPGA